MAITYNFEDIKKFQFPKRIISSWIKSTAGLYNKKTGDISYIFCSDEYIIDVNRNYLNHDYYTDIITFDYSEGNTISGDLFISLDTVKSNAELYHQQFEKELFRVIIHGILHLCGQNDKTDKQQAEMTEKEDLALRELAELLEINKKTD